MSGLVFANAGTARPRLFEQYRKTRLSRTLGEQIETQTVLGVGTWTVEVDIAQLENALLNLSINARDAMPDGGKLTIVHHGRLDRGVDLLGKPFTFAQLAEKVRLVLDRR